jgi:protein gp37
MSKTSIEWTDFSWNPIAAFTEGKRGWFCKHVSEECRFCYAERINRRLGNGLEYVAQNESKVELRIVRSILHQPFSWRNPRRVFVCSMTDLFLEGHSFDMIDEVLSVMSRTAHTYQILTKRPERMRQYFCGAGHPPVPLSNVWLGVSVGNQQMADERIPKLIQTPASVRFVSAEPLLGQVNLFRWLAPFKEYYPMLNREPRLDWVITGGESGPKARPSRIEWFRTVMENCAASGVPFFMKQITFKGLKVPFDKWPEDLKVREFPTA